MRVVVTEIGWDGSIRRRVLETTDLTDAGCRENLIEQVFAVPRCTGRLRAARSMSSTPVTAVVVGEENLIGSLQELVRAIL